MFGLILSELRKVVPYTSATIQELDGDELVIVGGQGFPDLDDLIGQRFAARGPQMLSNQVMEDHLASIVSGRLQGAAVP